MSNSTISTFQLFALFPDEETARVYLEGRLWPSGPITYIIPYPIRQRPRAREIQQKNLAVLVH